MFFNETIKIRYLYLDYFSNVRRLDKLPISFHITMYQHRFHQKPIALTNTTYSYNYSNKLTSPDDDE